MTVAARNLDSDIGNDARAPQPRQLRYRLERMAQRWRYTATELAEVLSLARQDPKRWLAAIELDEQREAEFRAAGVIQ